MRAQRLIVVDAASPVPPYQQIVDQIRALIQSGELARGAVLPTIRQLAGDLRVAPNTVARAYGELAGDGWIEMEGRRGTRVAGEPPSRRTAPASDALTGAVAQFIEHLTHRGYSRSQIRAAFRSIDQ